jgi:hypothetical protein
LNLFVGFNSKRYRRIRGFIVHTATESIKLEGPQTTGERNMRFRSQIERRDFKITRVERGKKFGVAIFVGNE